MKNSLLIYTSLMLLFFTACQEKKAKKVSGNESKMSGAKQECYTAIFEKDTAYLSIKRSADKKVEGNLLIQYSSNPKNEGKLKGEFRGDTLFADYTYTIGTNKNTVNKNPLAFLTRGDSLILGIGQIETYAGRAYFKPGTPIDFDRGRFRFVTEPCKK